MYKNHDKSYDKSYDHKYLNFTFSTYEKPETKTVRLHHTNSMFLLKTFSLVKIFFWIQISRQFIKQTIIWNATVYFFLIWNAGDRNFQTEHTDKAFHHFYNSNSSVHFLWPNI